MSESQRSAGQKNEVQRGEVRTSADQDCDRCDRDDSHQVRRCARLSAAGQTAAVPGDPDRICAAQLRIDGAAGFGLSGNLRNERGLDGVHLGL